MKKNNLQQSFGFKPSQLIIALLFIGFTACNQKSSSHQEEGQSDSISPLASAAQLRADSLSARLLANKELIDAEAGLYQQLLTVSKDSDAIAAIKPALHHAAQFATQLAIAEKAADQQFLWQGHADRKWHNLNIPGSKYGLDNPDNIYRLVYLDSTSSYEIHVHHQKDAPIQESFEVFDGTSGAPTFEKNIAFIQGKNIKADADGNYTITLSSKADTANQNHLQITKARIFVLYRNTLSDWTKQLPTAIDVKRLSGTPAKEVTEAELVKKSVSNLKELADLLVMLRAKLNPEKAVANTISKPFVRDGGWGFASAGNFNLAADQAWIIKLNPKSAKYVGFQLADPWLVSLDYINHSASLNNNQAVADKDGNFTYVVSAQNPGVVNWLDTRGLKRGSLLIRWQLLPADIKAIDDAVIEQKVVKVADLAKSLSADTKKLSLNEYQKQFAERQESYQRRLAAAK